MPSSWKQRGYERLNQQWQDWRWRVCMGSWGEPYLFPMSSIPPPKKCCHTPTATISKLPPKEPEEAAPEALILQLEKSNWQQKLPPQLCHKLWGGPPSPHGTPAVWGASRGFTSAGWRGAVRGYQPHRLHSVHRDHLGVSLACPLCTRTFLNLGALRHHRKIHSSSWSLHDIYIFLFH